MNQWQLDESLIDSAFNGQLDDVECALQEGANVNARDKVNRTSIYWASQKGFTDIAQHLLKAKANLNIPNEYGSTPLMAAAANGQLDIVKLLLENGANIHHINESGHTALHRSASNNHTEIIKVLVSYDADIAVVDKDGCSALHIAAANNHIETIKVLMGNGANISIVNKIGRTALHLAASNNHPEVIKVLISNGADITVIDKDGKTAAEVAQGEGYRNIAKLIIDEALQRLFKRGLHKGNVQLTNMRLVLIGPPCVGKTSFKSLLFNWSAPKFHDSTALATRPIRAIERVAGHNEGKIWEKVTSLDLLKMLSDAIYALEQNSQQEIDAPISGIADGTALPTELPYDFMTDKIDTSISVTAKQNVKGHSTGLVLSTSNDSMEMAFDITSTKPNQAERETKDSTNFGMSSNNTSVSSVASSASTAKIISSYSTNSDPDQYSKELTKLLAKQKVTQNRHKATWINILDSGGQPQFADVSRAFIRGNNINIICTKLTESLLEKPQFSYSLNGKLLSQPNELQMNNLQLIEHYVRSIVSSRNVVVKGKKSLPLFMIIGTYYDKTKVTKRGLHEPLELKNEQLLSTLSEFHDHFIFHKENPKELIFPVDNLCWWNRKKISSSLRQHIMSYQKDIGIAVPIPVRWYMFELRLKEEASQDDHGMISLKSCCGIGVSLGMDENDVLKSLSYLHTMALFLYFPIVLCNVIFTNPQYLLDMLSSLIRVSFVDSLEEILLKGKSIAPDSWRAFREFGVFDESLLDNIYLPFVSSLFTKCDFLILLRYLHIITQLSTTDGVKRYFMPAVLPPNQAKEKDISLFQKNCDPMIITFASKVVPQGVFPAVVVALVDRTKSPQFDIDSCSIAFPRQLRYAVLLYSESLFGSVLLVDRFYWIEVYYNGMTENCFKVHKVICEAISACTDILAYNEGALKAEVTVPCKQEHSESGHKLHPVIISWDHSPPLIRCSIEKQLPTLKLNDERQTCWLIDPYSVIPGCNTSRQHDESDLDLVDISNKKIVHDSDVISVSLYLPNGPLDECHLSALVKFVKEIDNWEILGIHLGVKDAVIKDIKALNHFQPAPSRKDMLVKWLKGGNANRADFIEALKAIDENRIVKEILFQNDLNADVPTTVIEATNNITKLC